MTVGIKGFFNARFLGMAVAVKVVRIREGGSIALTASINHSIVYVGISSYPTFGEIGTASVQKPG